MNDQRSEPGADDPPAGLRGRVAGGLRQGAAAAVAAGGHGASELNQATRALALQVAPTSLSGERALAGHVLGMHLLIPASHLHGPRQEPVLIYLFADALAIRPTRDAPMSSIPLPGLHMLLPPVAVARWVYKAGRVEHANLDLVKDEQRFADSLSQWTVDDFAQADQELDVHMAAELPGPLHVYGHLAYAHIYVPVPGERALRLKSDLPAAPGALEQLEQLCSSVKWAHGLSTQAPQAGPGEGPGEAPAAPGGS
jgi:hypothetical protein